ncbi:hypothetical protein SAMN04487969_12111 [Paenibacillus algorifonticola]|uniref:Uncharacterized protein n=1 Tax=Paenibacillus algorifonticola TaxID=684063 RepID=A0A1I2H9Q0_9BACL|nr:hypothetical protein SAMN04487969_12111 [Paenibacillus algorifonticola]
MSKKRKILIAVSLFLLVFSLVAVARTFLRDHVESKKIEELTRIFGGEVGQRWRGSNPLLFDLEGARADHASRVSRALREKPGHRRLAEG